jgi:hypothetical protein
MANFPSFALLYKLIKTLSNALLCWNAIKTLFYFYKKNPKITAFVITTVKCAFTPFYILTPSQSSFSLGLNYFFHAYMSLILGILKINSNLKINSIIICASHSISLFFKSNFFSWLKELLKVLWNDFLSFKNKSLFQQFLWAINLTVYMINCI